MPESLKTVLSVLRWMSQSRLTLAMLYILAVPFFAWRFTYLRHAFYEDKIRLELPYTRENRELTDDVFQALLAPVVTRPSQPIHVDDATVVRQISPVRCNQAIEAGSGTFSLNVWTSIDLQQVTATGAGAGKTIDVPMEITFIPATLGGQKTFGGIFYKPSDSDFHLQNVIDAEIRIDPSWHFQAPALTGEQLTKIESLIVTNALRARIKSQSDGVYKVYLAMPLPEAKRLERFLLASSGFTSDLSDNSSRMIYFSLTTITTLGFGDIVPISTEARKWVCFEAVTGLLLMGLFLNSLVR